MIPVLRRFAALMLFAFLIPAAPAAQTPGDRWSLETAVMRSEAMVLGRVVEIAYRESQAGEGLMVAPHSFVTYRLEQVLRGEVTGRTLTLRFMGGWDPSTGRVALSPGAPMFQVGDRDILLITGNGTAFCPLVGCGLGRFRVVDEAVYGNLGLALRIRDDGVLVAGPDSLPQGAVAMVVPPAPEARLRELREQLAAGDLDTRQRTRLQRMIEVLPREQRIEVARLGEPAEPPAMAPASLEAFVTLLRQISQRYPARLTAVESASPEEPFEVRELRPAPMPVTGRPTRSLPETLEQQRLHLNGGNPVLGASR